MGGTQMNKSYDILKLTEVIFGQEFYGKEGKNSSKHFRNLTSKVFVIVII